MTAILFDLDGVLIDSWEAVEASFLAAAAEFGLDGTARLFDFRVRMGMPLEVIVSEFSFPLDFAARFRSAACAHDHKARAFPGVAEMLQSIRQANVKVGVVTGKDRPRTLAILELAGLARHIDAVVTASDAPGKPAPDGLILCEQLLGEGPSLAFIGDTAIDLQAARSADRTAVLASWGGGPKVHRWPGVIEIARPDDVIQLIGSLSRQSSALALTP